MTSSYSDTVLIEKVVVITVNWNRFEDTCECVDSLITQEGVIIDLIVVDNGSTDSSYRLLQEKYPQVKTIRSDKNLGFAGGYNLGIKYALTLDTNYIMIINNDTVAKKDTIKKLISEMADEEIGAASPLILYHSDPEKIWSSGGDINPTVLMPIDSHHRNEIPTEPVFRTFLSGCCFLMKKSLIETVGLFDERFFLYLEDLDYCLRIMRLGWRMKLVPSSRLLHKVSLSSGGELSPRERYYMALSTILYYRKHVTICNFIPIFLFRLISFILWTFRLLFSFDITALRAYWQGTIRGFGTISSK